MDRNTVDIMEKTGRQVRKLAGGDSRILAVYLLGSALNGDMRTDSDIDLGIMPEPGKRIPPLDRAELAGVLSEKLERDVDIGEITSGNLVYSREALLKGKMIYAKNKDRAKLYRAQLLGMYIQYNSDRREVADAYKTG